MYVCMFIVCIPHCLYPFICWWTLGLLPIWAVINSVAMNFGVYVSFQIGVLIYFRYIPSSEIVGLYISSAFSILRTSIPFSIVAASIYIPPAVYPGSLFPHLLWDLLFADFFFFLQKVPFKIGSVRKKYLGIKLTKGEKDLYYENYKTLDEGNRSWYKEMETYPVLLHWKN